MPPDIAPPVLVARVDVEAGSPLRAVTPDSDGQWRHVVATADRIRRNSSWYSSRRVLHRADVIRTEMAESLVMLSAHRCSTMHSNWSVSARWYVVTRAN